MYGNRIPPSPYDPRRSVIGEVTSAPNGNVVLRIGGLWTNEPERGWQQTEHVVLQAEECGDFIRAVVDVMPHRYGPTLTIKFNPELAADVIKAIGGEIVDDETTQRLQRLRENLVDFVNAKGGT